MLVPVQEDIKAAYKWHKNELQELSQEKSTKMNLSNIPDSMIYTALKEMFFNKDHVIEALELGEECQSV